MTNTPKGHYGIFTAGYSTKGINVNLQSPPVPQPVTGACYLSEVRIEQPR